MQTPDGGGGGDTSIISERGVPRRISNPDPIKDKENEIDTQTPNMTHYSREGEVLQDNPNNG